ncbi:MULTISPECIES: DUF4845 domain-containing protein [unclassified Acinetobacter]|uniref:DUF4845 domain-containing protein n=1 Tax=unclassified Acinetobacter TaxID=196816 RepID=UPI0035B7ECCC
MRNTQRGASISSIMSLLILAALSLKIFASLFPPFIDDRTIDSQLESMVNSGSLDKTKDEFLVELEKKLDMNNIRDLKPTDIVKIQEGKKLKVTKDYEVRKNFVSNIDFVIKFHKEY